MSGDGPGVNLTLSERPRCRALALTDDEIRRDGGGLRCKGGPDGDRAPRMHLVPESSDRGHFNVLRGVVWPLGLAGVKIVGDFVDN